MKLNNLSSVKKPTQKRLGRGYGSGKGGHTSTRGQKGQKSRSSIGIWFEGGQLPLTKRLPFLRGKDRFKVLKATPIIVNLNQLASFKTGSIISKESLVKAGLISLKEAGDTRTQIKILGTGDLKVALKFTGVSVSKQATQKISQAGGSVE